jgi:hypothetical protein
MSLVIHPVVEEDDDDHKSLSYSGFGTNSVHVTILRSQSKVGIYPSDPPAAARYAVVRLMLEHTSLAQGKQLCVFCLTTRPDMWSMACLVG